MRRDHPAKHWRLRKGVLFEAGKIRVAFVLDDRGYCENRSSDESLQEGYLGESNGARNRFNCYEVGLKLRLVIGCISCALHLRIASIQIAIPITT